MHLCADTVNLCVPAEFLTLGLPNLNPLDERLQLLVLIPVRLKVVVVDEELEVGRVGAFYRSICVAGSLLYDWSVLLWREVVLPIEASCSIVRRDIRL